MNIAKVKASNRLTGIARVLVSNGMLDIDTAKIISEQAGKERASFIDTAIDKNVTNGREIGKAISSHFGIPLFDTAALDLEYMPTGVIAEGLIEKHNILPIYQHDTKLFVSVADPTNTQALNEINFHTGLGIIPIQANPTTLKDSIALGLDHHDTTNLEDLISTEEGLEDLDVSDDEDGEGAGDVSDIKANDAPIVKYVNSLLVDAIQRGASDIHIEPYEKHFRVRFRIDGVLKEIASQPINLAPRVAARVKIIAKLDIAERRAPQDGRMKLRLSKSHVIDFRVNTLPTVHGEKVVIRLLDSGSAGLDLESLGFSPEQKLLYEAAIERPYGMILITGPTGSGKTVSLYTALGTLNTMDRNISTVEDPVEIHVEGINQVNINEKANLTFATALRSFLRQDPDIIMVGEIRDLETAEIAVKASQTGHLVLSTLHTNDAPATLTRLLNMGVPSFNIASAVHLIVAQRLTRNLCPGCKEVMKLPEKVLIEAGFKEDQIKNIEIFKPVGCTQCTEGFRGRSGIFQVMPMTEELRVMIMEGCTEQDIAQSAARSGVLTLRQAGLEKVRLGVTSLEEVERVTNQ